MGGAMKRRGPTNRELRDSVAGGIKACAVSLEECRMNVDEMRDKLDQMMFRIELDINAVDRLLQIMEKNNARTASYDE